MRRLPFLTWLLLALPINAGVYGDLQFGDSRETITRKLSESPLVEQTIDNTYIARTGLNGIYKCKARISGLVCQLYFNWDQHDRLIEITLRSETLNADRYKTDLKQAWSDAGALFAKVYHKPKQEAPYPDPSSFGQHKMMISHVWESDDGVTIYMGSGMDKNTCFLFVRFVPTKTDLKS